MRTFSILFLLMFSLSIAQSSDNSIEDEGNVFIVNERPSYDLRLLGFFKYGLPIPSISYATSDYYIPSDYSADTSSNQFHWGGGIQFLKKISDTSSYNYDSYIGVDFLGGFSTTFGHLNYYFYDDYFGEDVDQIYDYNVKEATIGININYIAFPNYSKYTGYFGAKLGWQANIVTSANMTLKRVYPYNSELDLIIADGEALPNMRRLVNNITGGLFAGYMIESANNLGVTFAVDFYYMLNSYSSNAEIESVKHSGIQFALYLSYPISN
jgi:hypothetical protein